jgi:hypothetical protein
MTEQYAVEGRRDYCRSCNRAEHHDPNCPEMFFGGDRSKPRGVPGAGGPHDGLSLGDEMSRIFAGGNERMVARHLAEQRRKAKKEVHRDG